MANEKKLKPLTAAEKAEMVQRALMQRRETFAQGILFNLCQNPSATIGEDLVKRSVEMADALIKALYPVPEDE